TIPQDVRQQRPQQLFTLLPAEVDVPAAQVGIQDLFGSLADGVVVHLVGYFTELSDDPVVDGALDLAEALIRREVLQREVGPRRSGRRGGRRPGRDGIREAPWSRLWLPGERRGDGGHRSRGRRGGGRGRRA